MQKKSGDSHTDSTSDSASSPSGPSDPSDKSNQSRSSSQVGSKKVSLKAKLRWLSLMIITIALGTKLADRSQLAIEAEQHSLKSSQLDARTPSPASADSGAAGPIDGITGLDQTLDQTLDQDADSLDPYVAEFPSAAPQLQSADTDGDGDSGGIGLQNNRLIIDSIVSIIQHYYVKAGATDSLDLIKGALEQITKANHHYSLLKRGDIWSLTFDMEDRISYDLSGTYTYDSLINDIQRSNQFLQANENATYQEPEDTSYFFLNHMLQALDRHSALLESDNYRNLKQGTEGSFGGLGVIVSIKDHLLTVIEPIQDSPAAKAGIEQGDIIVAINDFLTFGADLSEIIEKMRGKPDTDVVLTILKDKGKKIKDVKIKRKVVKLYSVEDKLIRHKGQNVLNLKVTTFSTHTAEEIVTALRKAERKTRGDLAGIILDLRDNPGGLLDQAIEVSDIFLEKGEIIVTKGRETELESAKVGSYENSLPLVVLINSQSASASEIVAGALKDNERAVVIGEPSYGKGTVQTIFELPEDRALKLTIAHYLTPSRIAIQDHGVMPHVWLAKITPTQPEALATPSQGQKTAEGNSTEGKEARATQAKMNAIRLNSHSYYHKGNSYDQLVAKVPDQHRFYIPAILPAEDKGFDRKNGLATPLANTLKKSRSSFKGTTGPALTMPGTRPSALSAKSLEPKVRDPELWSSLYLLSTLKNHYNIKAYAFDYRKATWFAKVQGLLENQLVDYEQQNLANLAENNGVYWFKPQHKESCSFDQIAMTLRKMPSEQQDLARVAVTVRNSCSIPLDRISVHLKTNQLGYPYEELAIGHVMADTRVTKVITIPMPTGELEEPFEVSGVMVVDSYYTDKQSEPIRFSTEPREQPKFATTASITRGASWQQQTDPYTVITFNLENLSNYHMERLEAELVNLSGGSMSVASPKATIYQLGTKGKKQISFAVMGLDLTSPTDAYLGLKIKTPYFKTPITKSVRIHGFPSKTISVMR